MTEREVADGIHYSKFKWKESRCHILRIDRSKRLIRAIPSNAVFPLTKVGSLKPPQLAKTAGAAASVGGGFSITTWHGIGITKQPTGTLMINREIWTTGLGHGGHAYLGGADRSWVQPSKVEVRLWNKGKATLLDSINRGHVGINAFNHRGGTNEFPSTERYRMVLDAPGEWLKNEQGHWLRYYNVASLLAPGTIQNPVSPERVVIESDEPLGYAEGDQLRWVQDVGAPGVNDIVAGMTELVREGKNAIKLFDVWSGGHDGPDGWYIQKNPRTAIGVSEDGLTLYVVAVEGRVKGSKGFRLKEFANLLIEQGAWSATNMDGGGSTHMWIRGQKNAGLVADSCYGDGTLDGTRPNIYATAIF